MITRNLRPIIGFIFVSIIIFTLFYLSDNSCLAIRHYSYEIQYGVGRIIANLFYAFIVFITGIFLFFLIRKKINPGYYGRFKLIYFSVLPLLIFYPMLVAIPINLKDRDIETAICDKSSKRGLVVQSQKISLREYDYLRTLLYLLPTLPASSEDINIQYYHDNFLPDFMLEVNFICGVNEKINANDGRWIVQDTLLVQGKKKVVYNDIEK